MCTVRRAAQELVELIARLKARQALRQAEMQADARRARDDAGPPRADVPTVAGAARAPESDATPKSPTAQPPPPESEL